MAKVGFMKLNKPAKGRVTSDEIYKASQVRKTFQALFDQESLKRNGGQARWTDCWNCHQKFALLNNLAIGDTCPYCQAKELLK